GLQQDKQTGPVVVGLVGQHGAGSPSNVGRFQGVEPFQSRGARRMGALPPWLRGLAVLAAQLLASRGHGRPWVFGGGIPAWTDPWASGPTVRRTVDRSS